MEHYNKYDVLSLEELYDIMIPWDNTINHSIFNDGEHVCSCGSSKLQKMEHIILTPVNFNATGVLIAGPNIKAKKIN